MGVLDGARSRRMLPSAVACTQPERTVCNQVQGETAEKSKSRAPTTPPSRSSSGLHIDRFLWGVAPQVLCSSESPSKQHVRACRPGWPRRVTGPLGRGHSRQDHEIKRSRRWWHTS